MSETDLRSRIKEMLVKNLMLQTTPDQIADDLPLFGPNGLGLDSIDALELVVGMEDLRRGCAKLRSCWQGASNGKYDSRLYSRKTWRDWLSWPEAIGMVDLQKFKPPQAATKLGDIPEIIEHRKNGLLIESGDSKSLAAAILAFISNEKLTALCAATACATRLSIFRLTTLIEARLQVEASFGKHRNGKTASCAQ